ncbi:MAG: trypsin-like peptidase domain-containing protein [Eubacteriales bacterium]
MEKYYKDRIKEKTEEKPVKTNTNEKEIKKSEGKKRRGLTSYFIVALCAAIIGGMIGGYIFPSYLYGNIIPVPENLQQTVEQNESTTINTSDNINFAAAVVEKASDSVVGITTRETFRDFFGDQKVQEGIGSGVIVREDGYILTNSHVISDGNSDSIEVLFSDGTTSSAEVLWFETLLDLAIIKVERTNLKAAELGDSDSLVVGEPVVAIGNPLSLDLDRTVTSGIVSGLDRTLRLENSEIEPLIQTDASINPGNSGGPLLNAQGQIVGINTAKMTSAEGLGFSIPINEAKPILNKIISGEKIEEVYIGIIGVDLDTYEERLGVELSPEYGVVIVEVLKDSPAYKAGLEAGDIIQNIDGYKTENMNNIIRKLYEYNKGDSVEIEIIRDSQEIDIELKFEEKPENF